MHLTPQAKKLVLVLMTSASVTGAKEAEIVKILDQVSFIHYLVQFQKDRDKDVLALFDFKSKVNAMTPAYVAQLDLKVQKTNVNAQKIDKSLLKTYGIVIVAF